MKVFVENVVAALFLQDGVGGRGGERNKTTGNNLNPNQSGNGG